MDILCFDFWYLLQGELIAMDRVIDLFYIVVYLSQNAVDYEFRVFDVEERS